MATPSETKIVMSGADVEFTANPHPEYLELTIKQGTTNVLIEMPSYTVEKLLEELRDYYKPQLRRR